MGGEDARCVVGRHHREVIHLCGPAITCGSHRRQRCSWCGTIIEDVDLSHIGIPLCAKPYWTDENGTYVCAVGDPTGECGRNMGHGGGCGPQQPGDFTLAGWAFEAMVDIDGTFPKVTTVVEPELHEDGTVKIPEGSCMSLPVEVTV